MSSIICLENIPNEIQVKGFHPCHNVAMLIKLKYILKINK